jgi:predicted nucleotidyltransferase component of viral defense system
VEDLAGRKLHALFDRAAARDFVDDTHLAGSSTSSRSSRGRRP